MRLAAETFPRAMIWLGAGYLLAQFAAMLA